MKKDEKSKQSRPAYQQEEYFESKLPNMQTSVKNIFSERIPTGYPDTESAAYLRFIFDDEEEMDD